jgi:hypothetical protein
MCPQLVQKTLEDFKLMASGTAIVGISSEQLAQGKS